LTQPSFPEKEVKKLKSETISNIQEELGHDGSIASRHFSQFLFQEHPYGKPVIGSIRDIKNLTRSQIVEHYRRVLNPESMIVLGSGDANPEVISSWAEEVAKSSLAREPVLSLSAKPKNFAKRRLLIIDKPDRTQTQIYIGQIGIRISDEDYFPLYLGNHAFGGGTFSAILMEEIRVKKGWSYGANSSFRHGLQPRSWSLHLYPAEKDTAAALERALQLVEDLKNQGLTQAQFEFAKRSLINSSGFMYNTPKKRVENKLLEKTLELPDGFMQSYGVALQKIQLSDVNQSLKKFLQPGQLAIAVLGTAQNLKEQLIKVSGIPEDQVEVVPYTKE
jgi:zinc protease